MGNRLGAEGFRCPSRATPQLRTRLVQDLLRLCPDIPLRTRPRRRVVRASVRRREMWGVLAAGAGRWQGNFVATMLLLDHEFQPALGWYETLTNKEYASAQIMSKLQCEQDAAVRTACGTSSSEIFNQERNEPGRSRPAPTCSLVPVFLPEPFRDC